MPTNVTQGSCVQFSVVFFDSAQNPTVPSSGSITIIYTSVTGSTASTTISLVQTGDFFTGPWDTSVAALGKAIYSANAPGEATVPAVSGQLRIMTP